MASGAVRMHLHDGRVQFDGLNLDAHDLLALQLLKYPIQDGALKNRPPRHWQVARRMDYQDSDGCRGCYVPETQRN
jgi:hypothetical protein